MSASSRRSRQAVGRPAKGWLSELDISLPAAGAGYVEGIPALRHFGRLALHPRVTYFIGENGCGKSTLSEALACCLGLNPEGGNRNIHEQTMPDTSRLHEFLSLTLPHGMPRSGFFFRAESMFQLFVKAEAQKQDPFGWHSYGWSDRHKASHGEGHWSLFTDKVVGQVLLFDEPESALSPEWQLAFLARIPRWLSQGSQLIIFTHSPLILAYPDALIYHLRADGPTQVVYEESHPYLIYRDFLTRPQRFLAELLDDQGAGP